MKHRLPAMLMCLTMPLGLATTAWAGSEEVLVEDAWARASIGTGRPAAAYMKIRNAGNVPVTLTGLETAVADAKTTLIEDQLDHCLVAAVGPIDPEQRHGIEEFKKIAKSL